MPVARAAPGRRDVVLTVTMVVLVCAFGAMCWWQVTRALSGNSLSWAYVFEWPLFAGYVVYMWHRLSRDGSGVEAGRADTPGGATSSGPPPSAEDEEDEELAAYNRYLASLEESGRRKRW